MNSEEKKYIIKAVFIIKSVESTKKPQIKEYGRNNPIIILVVTPVWCSNVIIMYFFYYCLDLYSDNSDDVLQIPFSDIYHLGNIV